MKNNKQNQWNIVKGIKLIFKWIKRYNHHLINKTLEEWENMNESTNH